MINIAGYITDQTSYGLVTLNILNNLTNDYCLFPNNRTNLLNNYTNKVFDTNSPSLRIDHQYNMANSVGIGKRFGYTFFELDQFTDLEKCHLNSLDHLFVASQWAKNICDIHLSTQTSIAPLAVDRSIFKEVNFDPNKFIFLSIGKWEKRKGQDEIVNCFNKAFNNNKDVELWMFFDSPNISQKLIEEKTKLYSSSGNIKCFSRLPTQYDVARIIQQSSCFISHSKAEGWNMELLEAMSCGIMCISPNHTGESEFINDKNCIITDVIRSEPADDGHFFGKGLVNTGNWNIPSNDSLISNMRFATKNHNKNLDGIETAKKFTWKNTVSSLESIIYD